MEEDFINEIVGFLRHDKVEVRKKALETLMSVSASPEFAAQCARSDMLKAIKACLYELVASADQKLVHSSLVVLLNLSSHKQVVATMEEHKIMDSLLQIIFNVMKTISKEDLGKLKHLFQDVAGVKLGNLPVTRQGRRTGQRNADA